jgi:hypothetical protein
MDLLVLTSSDWHLYIENNIYFFTKQSSFIRSTVLSLSLVKHSSLLIRSVSDKAKV